MKLLTSIFILLLISCFHSENRSIKDNTYIFRDYLKRNPRYRFLISDLQDSLILGFCKSTVDNDTSWGLFIRKSEDNIYGHYNQSLPFYVSGFDDYLDDSAKLIYSESFDFIVTKEKWDSLINQSGLGKYEVRDTLRYTGCPHCPDYTVYYDSKLILNSKLDNGFLVVMDTILHTYLINEILEKKRNPPIKLSK